ncbi:MAG: endo-1,4-beta-xylanase [Bryobacteraceae bacterium]
MKSESAKRIELRRLAAWMAIVLAGTAPLAAQTTLRQAASARGIPIGAAASADEYGETDPLTTNPNYVGILSTQYDMLEPGNAMKWDVTEPALNTYNFQPGDELVAFAQKYGMRVRGHNLCWYNQLPGWLTPYAKTASTAQMATLLQNHINTEVTHYAGKVFAWDVVNEAFSANSSGAAILGNSIWYNQPGIGIGSGNGDLTDTGYIEQAFRWAHAADPNALLFYNDYGIEGPGTKFTAVYNMVQDFVNRGVPINGVGFEMHLELDGYPSVTGLAQNMQALAALGIQVHITEMDVRLLVNSSDQPSTADLQTQAQIYQNIMTVCLQQPNCTAFQVWGVSYNDSWIRPSSPGYIDPFPGYGAPLPFDYNYQPTPAFNALITALQTATPAPVLKTTEVVNAAGYQGGSVAPGELVTIFGAGYDFGPATLVTDQLDSHGDFSTNLDGAQVLFDGAPSPMVYAVAGQVSAIVPFEVASEKQTAIQYRYNPGNGSVASNMVTMPVAAAVPAIFALNASGTGPGAILNQDYSVNGASNPAAAGSEIQIFGTGGGAVTGGAMDGGIAPPLAGSLVTQPVTATIGGGNAQVDYAGPAPGLVNGVIQVNLTIPSGLTPGPQPVVITIGTAQSQAGITVAVQ